MTARTTAAEAEAARDRATAAQRLAKYEAWIREIERRQAELGRNRTGYMRGFFLLPPLSLVGFLWGGKIGGGALFTGIIMAAFGIYTVLVREGDYELNLAHLRKHAAALREAAREPGAPAPNDAAAHRLGTATTNAGAPTT